MPTLIKNGDEDVHRIGLEIDLDQLRNTAQDCLKEFSDWCLEIRREDLVIEANKLIDEINGLAEYHKIGVHTRPAYIGGLENLIIWVEQCKKEVEEAKINGFSSLYDYCLANNRHDLIVMWDTEKNARMGLSIGGISRDSDSKVYWKCKRGHSLHYTIGSMLENPECRYCKKKVYGTSYGEQFIYSFLNRIYSKCANKEKVEGYEFDIVITERNTLIDYYEYKKHKSAIAKQKEEKKVELCKKHEEFNRFIRIIEDKTLDYGRITTNGEDIHFNYKDDPSYKNRMLESVCRYILILLGDESLERDIDINEIIEEATLYSTSCCRYEKSVQYNFPILVAKAWDYRKNVDIDPAMLGAYGRIKVHWHCSECGHKFQKEIHKVTNSSRLCPKCKERLDDYQMS